MKVQRGDVVLVDFPFASQAQSKLRPALVIQNNRDNQRLHNTIIAQITGNLTHAHEPTRFLIDLSTPGGSATGLAKSSLVACENILTVEQRMIAKILGQLSDADMQQIDACLRAALALK